MTCEIALSDVSNEAALGWGSCERELGTSLTRCERSCLLLLPPYCIIQPRVASARSKPPNQNGKRGGRTRAKVWGDENLTYNKLGWFGHDAVKWISYSPCWSMQPKQTDRCRSQTGKRSKDFANFRTSSNSEGQLSSGAAFRDRYLELIHPIMAHRGGQTAVGLVQARLNFALNSNSRYTFQNKGIQNQIGAFTIADHEWTNRIDRD